MSKSSAQEKKHPCLSCGACCAWFRVSFYWREAEPADSPDSVPLKYCEDHSPRFRVMKGTNEKRGSRCIALQGKVGDSVTCDIYHNRPSPCRDFKPSYSDGVKNKRCDTARLQHNLKPLTPEDWEDLVTE